LHFSATTADTQFSYSADVNTVRSLAPYTYCENRINLLYNISTEEKRSIIHYNFPLFKLFGPPNSYYLRPPILV
jgi:hypothetical protein